METAKQYLEFLIGTIQDSESQLFSKLRFLPKTCVDFVPGSPHVMLSTSSSREAP